MSRIMSGMYPDDPNGYIFFHNFWIFHLWDHFFWKKLGEGGEGPLPRKRGGEGGMDQDFVPYRKSLYNIVMLTPSLHISASMLPKVIVF